MIIDIGIFCNFMSESMASVLNLKTNHIKRFLVLYFYSKKNETNKKISTYIKFKEIPHKKQEIDFLVLPSLDDIIFIGSDWSSNSKAVISHKNNTIMIDGETVR